MMVSDPYSAIFPFLGWIADQKGTVMDRDGGRPSIGVSLWELLSVGWHELGHARAGALQQLTVNQDEQIAKRHATNKSTPPTNSPTPNFFLDPVKSSPPAPAVNYLYRKKLWHSEQVSAQPPTLEIAFLRFTRPAISLRRSADA
jgi:hypothetical protein